MRITSDARHVCVAAASSCTVNGTAHWRDTNHRTGQVTYGSQSFALAGATAVGVVAAPDAGVTREVLAITWAEIAGTPAAETLTFSMASFATPTYTPTSRLFKAVHPTGAEVGFYSPGTGWQVFTAAGELSTEVAA